MFDRVGDEKDARAYLQALTTKMVEELDFLKQCAASSLANRSSLDATVRLIM